jgi:hypothetical protein
MTLKFRTKVLKLFEPRIVRVTVTGSLSYKNAYARTQHPQNSPHIPG